MRVQGSRLKRQHRKTWRTAASLSPRYGRSSRGASTKSVAHPHSRATCQLHVSYRRLHEERCTPALPRHLSVTCQLQTPHEERRTPALPRHLQNISREVKFLLLVGCIACFCLTCRRPCIGTLHIHMQTHTPTHTHADTHARTHTCRHTRLHTHMQTHTRYRLAARATSEEGLAGT